MTALDSGTYFEAKNIATSDGRDNEGESFDMGYLSGLTDFNNTLKSFLMDRGDTVSSDELGRLMSEIAAFTIEKAIRKSVGFDEGIHVK